MVPVTLECPMSFGGQKVQLSQYWPVHRKWLLNIVDLERYRLQFGTVAENVSIRYRLT